MPVRSSLPRSRHYAATFCKGVNKGLSVLRSSLHKKQNKKPRNRNSQQQLGAPCEVLKSSDFQTCHGVGVTRCLVTRCLGYWWHGIGERYVGEESWCSARNGSSGEDEPPLADPLTQTPDPAVPFVFPPTWKTLPIFTGCEDPTHPPSQPASHSRLR